MITGQIDEELEARVELRVAGASASAHVKFLVDTGFNGHMAVSRELLGLLQLEPGAVQRGITADGRVGFFDTVNVEVSWHDQPITGRAQVLDEPLIGTRLLRRNELFANWHVGGTIRLTPEG